MTIPLYFDDVPMGVLSVDAEGASFAYDPGWADTAEAFPLSLLMPLGGGPFGAATAQPWLSNLLPEAHLPAIGHWLGVARQDVVGLLERMGRDVAGAMSVGQPRSRERARLARIGSEDELERLIENMPKRPFLVGEKGISMSLAGAQEKLPVALEDGDIAIPLEGAPSTHILKPDNPRLFGSVQNEALCLALARRCGLRAAGATTGRAGGRSYLLVERYDRALLDGRWRRIHQEDFCQALGKPPAAKYQRNQSGIAGPSLPDMFGVTRKYMTAADQLRLLDAIIFNVLICNTDAHAKNYSVVLRGRDVVEFAPLYDLMCVAAWDGITRNLAQSIGGRMRGEYILARHWERMAQECGLRAVAVKRRVAALAKRVEAALDDTCAEVREMPAGDHVMLATFADEIRRRCRTVTANLGDGAAMPEDDDGPALDGRRMDDFA